MVFGCSGGILDDPNKFLRMENDPSTCFLELFSLFYLSRRFACENGAWALSFSA